MNFLPEIFRLKYCVKIFQYFIRFPLFPGGHSSFLMRYKLARLHSIHCGFFMKKFRIFI